MSTYVSVISYKTYNGIRPPPPHLPRSIGWFERFRRWRVRQRLKTATIFTSDEHAFAYDYYGDSWLNRFRVERKLRALKNAVRKANGDLSWWVDEGGEVYGGNMAEWGFASLRAFAAWLYQGHDADAFAPPESQEDQEADYYQHPVWREPYTEKTAQSHLVNGFCYNDCVLPVDFPKHLRVGDYREAGFIPRSHSVTSAPVIARELTALSPWLARLPRERFEYVHMCFEQYKELTGLSLQHQLPIFFSA